MLRAIGFVLAAGCWLGLAQAQEPVRLYVAVDGNDGAAGTAEAPFASLEKARDEVRTRRAAAPLGAVEVIVKGGTYAWTAPFELGKEDSGVVYGAAPGEEVRVSGGKAVVDWQPVSDTAVRERLDEAVRDKVMQADLKAAGVTDFGAVDGAGLAVYYRDRMMTIARWPNQGFTHIADLVVEDGHAIHGVKGSTIGKFKYEGDRPKRWVGEKDPWVHGYWFWDWSDQRQAVASIDVEKGEIAIKEPYHNYGYRKGQWYYAFNMLSELDTPGEWYLDRETGVLYFYPPEALTPGEVVVSVAPSLVTMKDVSNVTLRGFTFEAARKQAVSVSEGTGVLVAGCTIRNIGDSGIGMSGTKSGVVSCDLYRLGGTGISLSGGDRTTLTPAELFADNNHIHDYGQWYPMYNPGITINGVGNRATHNLIHDSPHMAIQFWGNDHLMEFNEIYRVCMESNDAGAIYAGRNWTMRGTVIRNNYLHDITGFEQRGCVGVYLDDMFGGTEISSNVFLRVTRAAFIGGGRDVHIENNVFVDCNPAVHVDARALNWAGYHADEWITEAAEKGTVSGTAYNKPPYSEKYPELVKLIEDEPKAPKGNVIARNICVGGKWDEFEGAAQPLLKIENNLLDADPLFVDAANQDYRLKQESPAYALGFKDIPMEKIGLYKDEFRTSTAAHAERWTENQIKAWYAQQPWLVGANFGPSTAINQLEMWQADTFDPATIDRELGWAAGLGMNTMRVFLHNLPWKEDAEGFVKRIDEFLTIADKHKIRPLFVPLDDVWDPHPRPGKQRDPKPGVHNSGWVQAPGAEILSDPARHGEIEAYIKGLLTRFGKDRRVLAWDLYNEPGNTNDSSYGPKELKDKAALTLALITKVFAAAREAAPEQPLTAGVWIGSFDDPAKMLPLTRFMLDHSDFISFHSYGKLADVQRIVETLKQHGRPLVCTEYMSRGTGSTFEAILPYLKEQN
ncbi:MAG: right-handed parallel beta-helix repeat-containing protein, partial [FCB group bacterium]|nr:right-handed parallel beta-helix repeat-containing protein [FCB group bacterium]